MDRTKGWQKSKYLRYSNRIMVMIAIANMMEFVTCRYDGLREQRLGFSFIQSEICKHFVKCLEQNYMEPFPKISLNSPRNITVVTIEMDLFCCCNVPDVPGIGPWITCDKCDHWYLQKCDGVLGKRIPKTEKYTCKKCYRAKP